MNHKIALVGNPNCGKTTLFNKLTGSSQYVGNWPGVTVEKKEGAFTYKGEKITLVDLPGIYSLSPYSMEEIITRDYIINEKPDGIINIIDGTNIERNLYLSLQLIELGRPMVIAINMMDDVEARGDSIDCTELSFLLGIPVVPIVARKGQNIDELVKVMEHVAHFNNENITPEEHKRIAGHYKYHHHHNMTEQSLHIQYDMATRNALNDVLCVLAEANLPEDAPVEFYASKLLECDKTIPELINLTDSMMNKIDKIIEEYTATSKYGDRETMMADARYKYIELTIKDSVKINHGLGHMSISDKIDAVLTHKYLAIPAFFIIMATMFGMTFGGIGGFLKGYMEQGIAFISEFASHILAGSSPVVRGLIVEGIIGGVGGVLVFLPQISVLFLFLSFMEDSGYMSRAAFIMDRLLRRLGLSGKSFIPMLMGFGCTTPAVMAARTMENEDDRKLTILLTPFMSCGAKLPIYGLFASMFFKDHEVLVVLSMYMIGMIVAICYGVFLKKHLFKGETAPFVMELPPYRLPDLKSIAMHTWEKCKGFMIKAGTVIFAMSIVVWFMENFDASLHMVDSGENSIFGMIGKFIAPLFIPLGFGIWQAVVSLITGIVAKEAVVSTMNTLFTGVAAISAVFTPLSAYAFMVFALLYMPCMAAFVTIKRELGSLKWALGAALAQTTIAYFISMCVYQFGFLIQRIF